MWGRKQIRAAQHRSLELRLSSAGFRATHAVPKAVEGSAPLQCCRGKSLLSHPAPPNRAPTPHSPRVQPSAWLQAPHTSSPSAHKIQASLHAQITPSGVAPGHPHRLPRSCSAVMAELRGPAGGTDSVTPRHAPVHGREDLPGEREEAQPHEWQGHRPQPRRELVIGEGWSEGKPTGSERSPSCPRSHWGCRSPGAATGPWGQWAGSPRGPGCDVPTLESSSLFSQLISRLKYWMLQ